MKNEKQLGPLQGIVISLAVVSIVFVVVARIIDNSKTQLTAGTTGYNNVETVETEFGNVATWLGIIIVAVIGFFVISLFGRQS